MWKRLLLGEARGPPPGPAACLRPAPRPRTPLSPTHRATGRPLLTDSVTGATRVASACDALLQPVARAAEN